MSAAQHTPGPRSRVLTALLDAKAIIEAYAKGNPTWRDLHGRAQDPLGAHQWLSSFGGVADEYGEEIAKAPGLLTVHPLQPSTREVAAMFAMQGLILAAGPKYTPDDIARSAVFHADALIKELAK